MSSTTRRLNPSCLSGLPPSSRHKKKSIMSSRRVSSSTTMGDNEKLENNEERRRGNVDDDDDAYDVNYAVHHLIATMEEGDNGSLFNDDDDDQDDDKHILNVDAQQHSNSQTSNGSTSNESKTEKNIYKDDYDEVEIQFYNDHPEGYYYDDENDNDGLFTRSTDPEDLRRDAEAEANEEEVLGESESGVITSTETSRASGISTLSDLEYEMLSELAATNKTFHGNNTKTRFQFTTKKDRTRKRGRWNKDIRDMMVHVFMVRCCGGARASTGRSRLRVVLIGFIIWMITIIIGVIIHVTYKRTTTTTTNNVVIVPPPPSNLRDICSKQYYNGLGYGLNDCREACAPGECCNAINKHDNCVASNMEYCATYNTVCFVLSKKMNTTTSTTHTSTSSIISDASSTTTTTTTSSSHDNNNNDIIILTSPPTELKNVCHQEESSSIHDNDDDNKEDGTSNSTQCQELCNVSKCCFHLDSQQNCYKANYQICDIYRQSCKFLGESYGGYEPPYPDENEHYNNDNDVTTTTTNTLYGNNYDDNSNETPPTTENDNEPPTDNVILPLPSSTTTVEEEKQLEDEQATASMMLSNTIVVPEPTKNIKEICSRVTADAHDKHEHSFEECTNICKPASDCCISTYGKNNCFKDNQSTCIKYLACVAIDDRYMNLLAYREHEFQIIEQAQQQEHYVEEEEQTTMLLYDNDNQQELSEHKEELATSVSSFQLPPPSSQLDFVCSDKSLQVSDVACQVLCQISKCCFTSTPKPNEFNLYGGGGGDEKLHSSTTTKAHTTTISCKNDEQCINYQICQTMFHS